MGNGSSEHEEAVKFSGVIHKELTYFLGLYEYDDPGGVHCMIEALLLTCAKRTVSDLTSFLECHGEPGRIESMEIMLCAFDRVIQEAKSATSSLKTKSMQ